MIPYADSIEKKLLALHDQRDKLGILTRDAIRLAGKAITAMQAEQMGKAAALLKELENQMAKIKKVEKGLEYYSLQAHQEYVEAAVFYNIIKAKKLPSYKDLRVGEMAYLLGIMDVVGELKRKAFEAMRKEDSGAAESYYAFMLDIYDSTYAMRFASSLVPDFRKKQDTARIQLEQTRGQLSLLQSMRKRR